MDPSSTYIYIYIHIYTGVKDKQFHSAKMSSIDLDIMNNVDMSLMESQNDIHEVLRRFIINTTLKHRASSRNYKGDEPSSLNDWLTGWLVLNMVVLYRKVTHTQRSNYLDLLLS